MPIRRGIKALSLLHCHTLFLKSSSQWEGSNFGPSICGGHSEALCIFVWSWHHQSADESAQSISLDLANSSKLSHSLHDFPSYLLYTYLLSCNMFMFQLGSNIYPNLSLSTKSLSAPFDSFRDEGSTRPGRVASCTLEECQQFINHRFIHFVCLLLSLCKKWDDQEKRTFHIQRSYLPAICCRDETEWKMKTVWEIFNWRWDVNISETIR